eukprot:CAMPEP_0197528300 /NCGR_PEP_ID=MMETSP1318-20131121/24623_1 /TAXON_ID=552666 /ORGANISM="Partenskyella glossopodia, Strain RCC365" /LENGTH=153 /DNA_ID=CAMNT_0043083343 /DNA_START=354 /DNA_END=812 /DNA_ORIENTATION=-
MFALVYRIANPNANANDSNHRPAAATANQNRGKGAPLPEAPCSSDLGDRFAGVCTEAIGKATVLAIKLLNRQTKSHTLRMASLRLSGALLASASSSYASSSTTTYSGTPKEKKQHGGEGESPSAPVFELLSVIGRVGRDPAESAEVRSLALAL